MKKFICLALLVCQLSISITDARTCRKRLVMKFQNCLQKGFDTSIEGCYKEDALHIKKRQEMQECRKMEQRLKDCGYSCGAAEPVIGGWTDFTEWSNCSESCGDGTQTRSRACSNPLPANGGADCDGEATETRACNNGGCPGYCESNSCYTGDIDYIALEAGTGLTSLNEEYRLQMQNDGNLVLYCLAEGNAVWASRTAGQDVSEGLTFKRDGDLVLFDPSSQKLWTSNSAGSEVSKMTMQNDGNFVLYTAAGEAVWATNTAGKCECSSNICYESEESYIALELGSSLTSPNGKYTLKMQQDGNLVLYCEGNALWASHTAGKTVSDGLMFQTDGNLVLYDTDNQPLWSSGTHGSEVSRMILQDDGNVVLYTSADKAVWASHTAGQC